MKTRGLLVVDVDSTLIREEGIDLLGAAAGVGEQVASITEKAMQGDSDFEAALIERVALLKGLPETIFKRVFKQIHFTKGAQELIEDMHQRGYKVGVVSGGFHEMVDELAAKLNVDYVKANRLEVKDGKLTGRVLGTIVTKEVKKAMLRQWVEENNLTLAQTIAVGDGANDLPMILTAGIGIAFNSKPLVREQAPYQINQMDLYQVIKLLEEIESED